MPRRGSLVHDPRPAARSCARRRRPRGPGTRLDTATSSPLTTSIRWSSPAMKLSTMTLRLCSRATSNAVRTSLVGREVDRDAAAVVAVERLDHHRDSRCARAAAHRVVLASAPARWRGTGRPRSARIRLVSSLSRGELDRDVRRAAGDRRLDPLLVPAVAELDQALLVEPDPGDVALLGRAHQRRGARARARGAGRSG